MAKRKLDNKEKERHIESNWKFCKQVTELKCDIRNKV